MCKLTALAAVRQGRSHSVWSGLGGGPFGEDRNAKSAEIVHEVHLSATPLSVLLSHLKSNAA